LPQFLGRFPQLNIFLLLAAAQEQAELMLAAAVLAAFFRAAPLYQLVQLTQ